MPKFPKKVSKTDGFVYFILILEWEGISTKIAQIFPRVRLRGNTLRGPGEICWERGFGVWQRSCPVAGTPPPHPRKDLHKVGEVQSLGKMSRWEKTRFGSWLFPPSASPFPPLCCAVAIPAGAAFAAGPLVPGTGGCPRLAPSAPGVGVAALPGLCHGYGGAAPMGLSGCCVVLPFSLNSSLWALTGLTGA